MRPGRREQRYRVPPARRSVRADQLVAIRSGRQVERARPLVHEAAHRDMVGALEQARAEGGRVIDGDRRPPDNHHGAETFAPIL